MFRPRNTFDPKERAAELSVLLPTTTSERVDGEEEVRAKALLPIVVTGKITTL